MYVEDVEGSKLICLFGVSEFFEVYFFKFIVIFFGRVWVLCYLFVFVWGKFFFISGFSFFIFFVRFWKVKFLFWVTYVRGSVELGRLSCLGKCC